jgi:parvulin-like peptidyl-prolyl isomerase
MINFIMNRHIKILWCALILLFSGCFTKEETRSVRSASVSEALVQSQPADEMVVARVNGQAIRRGDIASVLLRGRGKRLLEELIVLEAVRQEAAKKNIRETDVLIATEMNRILEDMAPGKPRREQLALLDYMLDSRGLTQPEFDLIVESQALLRELVNPYVEITEQMLREEYERQHGRRVEVRQLVVSNIRKIEQVQKRLASGEDFAEIIQETSEEEQSLLRGGLLGPISWADEDVPEPVRAAALGLQTAGRFSEPFQYRDETGRQRWCLLQLERVLPADGISFESVQDELAGSIQKRELRKRMSEREQSLRSKALVEIIDPIFE